MCSYGAHMPAAEKTALHVRVLCALLAAAARLVPVPLVDDWLRERVTRYMVGRTLGTHGRSFPTTAVAPLYSDERGCMEGCLVFLVWLPIKLVLYPLRKVVAWVLAARGLSQDLTLMLLLGRTLDRCLAAGMLRGGAPGELRAEARTIRQAYDNAARGFDTSFLRESLGRAAASVKGLPAAAVRTLRSMFRRRRDPSVDVEVPAADRETMDRGVGAIEAALERPEVQSALERFDRTFDDNLAVLRQRVARPVAGRHVQS